MVQKTYYLAINPKTGNWCISKTARVAWTTSDNAVFDTGTILADKAISIAKTYCKEQELAGIRILLLNS